MAFAISIQTDSSPIEAILKKLSDFDTYKDDLYVVGTVLLQLKSVFLTNTM